MHISKHHTAVQKYNGWNLKQWWKVASLDLLKMQKGSNKGKAELGGW